MEQFLVGIISALACLLFICLSLCIHISIRMFEDKKHKILPFLTTFLIFWLNIFNQILLIVYQVAFRATITNMVSCISICFIYNYLNVLNLFLLTFLILERYVQICCSPQLYTKRVKNTNKKYFYLTIFLAGFLITLFVLDWEKIIDYTQVHRTSLCHQSEWFGLYHGSTILITLNILFYFFTFIFAFKMFCYLKKNHPSKTENLTETATLNIFRSGHLVSHTCVELFKLVLAIILCHTIFNTPVQIASIVYAFFPPSMKLKSSTTIAGHWIIFFSFFYLLLIEIAYLNFVKDPEEEEVNGHRGIVSTKSV